MAEQAIVGTIPLSTMHGSDMEACPGHCFTLSRYDRHTGKWAMEKAPVYHIID